MKLYLPQPAKQEYRLTGIGCSVLNDTAFAAGTRNIAGGHQLKIAAFDTAARKLTIAEGEPGKLAVGMALHLWTCADDDNSPYELKIVSVDAEARTVTIDRDLNLKKEQLETAAEWIAAVPDLTREATAFAAGDLCFATGEYAFASGSLTLAGGFGAHAEGILCEARGDMSFAVGSMTRADGLAAVATGTNTRADGMFSTATGNGTSASGDSSIAAGSGTEAAADAAVAIGFRTRAAGRCALAAGGLAEANADFSAAIGQQVKTAAKYSMILGRHGELADTVENQGALAFAAGDAKARRLGLLIQPNRAIKNPLYPQEGEPEYLPEPDFALTVSGHLLPATVTAPGDALTLDHSRAGRWKITPAALVTPVLKNWRDGDRGELVVYNGGSKVLFPSAWHWIGAQPALKSSGVDVFTIFQVDDLIYIRHAEAGGSGGGTPGGSVDESRLLPALDSIPVGRNGNPIVFRAVSEGMNDHTILYMPCEDYADHSSYNRTITLDSNNSIAIDVSDKKFGAASLHGNGSNRAGVIAELPVAPFAADTTVHAWVKITDADDRCGIFDTYGAANGNYGGQNDGVGGLALWTYQGKLKAYKASVHFGSYWYDDDSGNLLVEADLPADYLNRWMHVALVRSGLNWILFADGVKLAENIKDFTPDKKFIRLAQHYDDAMTGNIDEFIVLDYAKWISDFTPPAAPATTLVKSYGVSAQSLVRSVNGRFPDEAGNVVVEAAGSTEAVAESRLLPDPATVPAGLAGHPVVFDVQEQGGTGDANTLLLMHLDNDVVDYSKYAHSAVKTGDVAFQTGKFGKGLKFASASGGSYLQIPKSTAFNLAGLSAWTFDVWVYKTQTSGYTAMLAKRSGSSPVSYQFCFYYNTNRPQLYNGSTYVATGAVELNTWTHVAFTYLNGTLKIWIGGQLDSTFTNVSLTDYDLPIEIGYHYSSTAEQYVGLLDELRLSSCDRTADPTDPMYSADGTSFTPPAKPYGVTSNRFKVSDKTSVAVETPADGELLIGQDGEFVKITLAELKARLNALS